MVDNEVWVGGGTGYTYIETVSGAVDHDEEFKWGDYHGGAYDGYDVPVKWRHYPVCVREDIEEDWGCTHSMDPSWVYET